MSYAQARPKEYTGTTVQKMRIDPFGSKAEQFSTEKNEWKTIYGVYFVPLLFRASILGLVNPIWVIIGMICYYPKKILYQYPNLRQ